MNRREALKLALGAAVSCATDSLTAELSSIPIIDAHIHLFDTSRPGGVPWPPKSDPVIYRPALPERYAQIARPSGVVGAIAVEASPLPSDNDWVLQQAAAHPIIVGFVGDLIPGSPTFAEELDRLRGDTLFVGIRYGNLWDRDLSADMGKPGFVTDLRRLAAYGLSLDCANPDAALIAAILKVSEQAPELRVIIDHLPHAAVPESPAVRKEFWANLEQLGRNPRIFMKLSEVPVQQGGRTQLDLSSYREKLDALWKIFGEDRILYGSDWPNSDHMASYGETCGLVREYASAKGRAAQEKLFWKNSVRAYRWHARQAGQPVLDG